MSILSTLPILSPSLRELRDRAANSFNPAMLGRPTPKVLDKNDNQQVQGCQDSDKPQTSETLIAKNYSATRVLTKKVLSYKPIALHQQHTLHYALKTIGYLPTPLLEALVNYLKGPTSKQYLHANAHLRLIIAVNAKLKTPLQRTELIGLRKRFAVDAVAMQAPKVWQQGRGNFIKNLKPITKRSAAPVSWQDKTIANADDGDMNIRCYGNGAASSTDADKANNTVNNYNRDQVVMLFLHGGGFCIGDTDTHHEFCHAICAQTGWSIVSVDYRLAPEHPVPTALRDSIAAYAWLSEHCHTLGAQSSRIVLAGDSAGGCLASMLAQQVADPSQTSWLDLGLQGQKTFNQLQNLPHPLAQMPIYPVTDIETDYPSWALYGNGLLLDHADIAVFDAACLQYSKLPREHPLLSPMTGNNEKVCPTFIVAAELDVLRDQAFAYAKQLTHCGVEVQVQTILGAPHGFIHFMSVHKEIGQETQNIIKQFEQFVYQVISTQNVQSAQKTLAA